MTNDLVFDLPDGRFNYRVGAIIIDNGKLLMVKSLRENHYWTVGGRVTLHESSEQAVLREVFEETGIHCEVERLAFVDEVFFTLESSGESFHELGFYYLIRPNAAFRTISDNQPIGDTPEDCFEWLPLDKLCDYTAYPVFFRTELQNIDDGIKHVVEDR